MLTCGGREATQTISSAMSWAETVIFRGQGFNKHAVKEALTGLQAFVHFVRGRLVAAEAHYGELGLDHACAARQKTASLQGSGWRVPGSISVTRMFVSTTSRRSEPVNARTAALVAQ